ncbi:hypothetical protein BJ684DRAFT_20579 [Piptocephalis cylindrospora]|uniref:EH domain-containing protein n=1 Tax=Piptocephalis cylindrospora TaxID=1907219 RepID=A0A4V1IY07_9FUNG|nr:hypothetical protein BJ684DRAFT_20579 [Piptocephalis cylindrospora]|eukprot:RKP12899.1 hypothetical protein BJ684DRAFT_20579 [Piptocephalis cylindrospora]
MPTAVLTLAGGDQKEEREMGTQWGRKKEEMRASQESLDKGKAFGVSLRPVTRSATLSPSRSTDAAFHALDHGLYPREKASLASPFHSSFDQSTSTQSGSSTPDSNPSSPSPPPIPQRKPVKGKGAEESPTVSSLMDRLPQGHRQRYMGAFRQFHPSYPDTPIPAYVVRQVWEASQLETATLARIWAFVHQGQADGVLDKKGWSVGLWLIDEHLAGHPYPIPDGGVGK